MTNSNRECRTVKARGVSSSCRASQQPPHGIDLPTCNQTFLISAESVRKHQQAGAVVHDAQTPLIIRPWAATAGTATHAAPWQLPGWQSNPRNPGSCQPPFTPQPARRRYVCGNCLLQPPTRPAPRSCCSSCIGHNATLLHPSPLGLNSRLLRGCSAFSRARVTRQCPVEVSHSRNRPSKLQLASTVPS